GEMTAEDVKFTVEQNLRPDVPGGSAPFFRAHLERIETPDKYTVVMHFKNRVWEVPSNFTQFVGYQNITSKKYIESVGEDKAALHPIGTGPYRHVEGKQGDYHRFEAVGNHWRKTPVYRELIVRRIPDPATRLAGLRSGEIDNALWKGMGSDSPFMYWYYPFHKGFSKDWKVPPYDPERAKKLLAEAGHAGGFEVRVNPLVMTYALDGPDMVEAVSLDWEKIG